MRRRVSALAVCSHYKSEESQVIRCEGCTDGTVIHVAFASKTDCKNWKDSKCKAKGGRQLCPIAKMIEEARKDE